MHRGRKGRKGGKEWIGDGRDMRGEGPVGIWKSRDANGLEMVRIEGKRWDETVKKLEKQIEEIQESHHQQMEQGLVDNFEDDNNEVDDEEMEDGEIEEKEEEIENRFKIIEHYIGDYYSLKAMTCFNELNFKSLVTEVTPVFHENTWRGMERIRKRKEK